MFDVRWFVVLLFAVTIGRNFTRSTAYRINVKSETPIPDKQATILNSYGQVKLMNLRYIRSTIVLSESNSFCGESSMDTLVTSLNSLKDKNSNDSDVLAHLLTFVPHCKRLDGNLSSAQISAALYGLQGMNSDFLEVSALLSALLGVMDIDTGTFDANEVGHALYGLRCMKSDSPEIIRLLSILGPKIEGCTGILDSVNLGMAFDGLQGMRGSSKVSSIVDFLYLQLDSLVIRTDQLQKLPFENLILLGKQLALTSTELIEAFSDKHPRWEENNLIIADEIARRFSCNSNASLDTLLPDTDELVVMRSSESQYITLSSRYNLLGAYDCRILPDITNCQEPIFSLVDARDGETSNVRYCMSRDRLLSSNSNSIESIGAKHLRTVDPLEFKKWLSNRTGTTRQGNNST